MYSGVEKSTGSRSEEQSYVSVQVCLLGSVCPTLGCNLHYFCYLEPYFRPVSCKHNMFDSYKKIRKIQIFNLNLFDVAFMITLFKSKKLVIQKRALTKSDVMIGLQYSFMK